MHQPVHPEVQNNGEGLIHPHPFSQTETDSSNLAIIFHPNKKK
jgi:hypothetical protein